MDKLTAIKIKYDDGTYSDEIPVSVLSENVEWDSTHTLVDVLGSIDVDVTGTVQDQISRLFNEKVSNSDMQTYVTNSMPTYITNWLNTNVNPVGSAVVVDSSLTISGAAADAKVTGDVVDDLKSALGEKSRNLLGVHHTGSGTSNGVTMTLNDDGSITLTGTATAEGSIRWYLDPTSYYLYPLEADDGETLTMSYRIKQGSYSDGQVYVSLISQGTAIRLDSNSSVTFQKTSAIKQLEFWMTSGVTFSGDFTVEVQIEKGSEATPYSRYGSVIANDIIARYENQIADRKAGWLGEKSYNLLGFKNNVNRSGNGLTFQLDKNVGLMKINGTASDNVSQAWGFGSDLETLSAENGETLTLGVTIESGSYSEGFIYLSVNNKHGALVRIDRETKATFIYDSSIHTNIVIYVTSGTAISNLLLGIQLEKGAVATPFHVYNGLIANDTTSRMEIGMLEQELHKEVETDSKRTLSTEKYSRDFTVGTFTRGEPSPASYRLRSMHFIPLDAFEKMTWENDGVAQVLRYDETFNYISYLDDNRSGLITKEYASKNAPNAKYIKFTFSSYPISSVTVDLLDTDNVKIYMNVAHLNKYEEKIRNTSYWKYDKRNIKKLCGNKFCFAIQTDTHYYDESEPWYRTSMKNLEKEVGLDFIANLGDIIRGWNDDPVSKGYADFQLAVNGMCDDVDTQTFMLMGNHDNNSCYATVHEDINSAFFPNELYALFVRQGCRNVDYLNKSRFYGYKDFVDIRVVFLNSSDLPYQELDEHDININEMRFSMEQVEWFRDVALHTDKKVLVLCHGSFAPKWGLRLVNSYLIVQYAEEFINNGGTFIGFISGHHHKTDATVYKKTTNILCDNGGQICELFSIDTDNSLIKTQQIGNNFTSQRIFHYNCQTVSTSTILTSALSGTLTWVSSDTTIATVSNGTVTRVASGSCAVTAMDENGNSEQWAIVC